MGKKVVLRALVTGCGAGLVLTATMLALRLWVEAPSFPERIADNVLLLIPQALFSAGLDRFGFAAKPLLFVGIVTAQVALASLGGLLYGALAILLAGRIDLTSPAVGGAGGILLGVGIDFVVLPALGTGYPATTTGGATFPAALALAALPGLAYGLALVALLRLATPPRPRREPLTGAFGVGGARIARRRAFALFLPGLGALITIVALRRLIGWSGGGPPPGNVAQLPSATATRTATTAVPTPVSSAAPLLATVAPTAATTATATPTAPATASLPPAARAIAGNLPNGAATAAPAPSPTVPLAPGTTHTAVTTPTALATRAPTAAPIPEGPAIPAGVAPQITPTAEFYLISKNLIDPTLKAEGWQLAITGLVARPQTLRQADLLLLPPTHLAATLECISNEPGGTLIGTAVWTGVPLRTILTSAAIQDRATHVVFVCADDYVERLPLEQALDPATMLVYAMNDAPLTARHGFPARLIAAGRYGMKNPKWLTRIELVDGAAPSYWSQRGWDPDAPVQVFTRVDAPPQTVAPGPVSVGGVAYAGDRGISRVEISADGGATWLPAALEPALSPVTWVRWAARWTPPRPGTYTLAARAVEADGTPQVAVTRTLNARGSTGYGRRDVTVTP